MLLTRWLWGLLPYVVVGAAACAFELDDELCLQDEHCNDGEICLVTNGCFACTGELCPAHVRCEGDGDCLPETQICADDGVCRQRCVVDEQCTLTQNCQGSVCEAYFGEPCVPGETPCYDRNSNWNYCLPVDNHGQPVAAYCSYECHAWPCPGGYECIDDYCYVVTGELRCNHPDPLGLCGSCVWQYCGDHLDTCCEGHICDDLLAQIALCDQNRNNESCLPMEDAWLFEASSENLRSCIDSNCDDGECLLPES